MAGLSLVGVASTASAVTCLTIPTGIEAWWPGDGTTDDLVHDRDGTLMNGAAYTTGVVGQAFTFDGQDDVVTVPDNAAWDLGDSDFTQAMWVKMDDVTSGRAIFTAHDGAPGSPGHRWVFYWDAGGLQVSAQGPYSWQNIVWADWAPSSGVWYHLAVSRTGDSWTLFVDGVALSSTENAIALPTVNGDLRLGWAPGNAFGENVLDGAMDEVTFFHRGLSTAEVKAIYDAGATGLCDPIATSLSMRPSKTTVLNGMQVSVSGNLGIEGSLAVDRDGHTITLTRSVDGGLPQVVATPTTFDGGFYEFAEVPPLGKVQYIAWFEGSGNAVPASAKTMITVKKGEAQVTLSARDRHLVIGQSTKLVAELVGGRVDREVTIWAKPVGQTKRVVQQGPVGSDDVLAATVTPRLNTTYWATYAGDISWAADTSREVLVSVRVKWSDTVLRDYGKAGKYHLFRYASACADRGESCPTFVWELIPAHPRATVTLQWEIQRANGTWDRVYQHRFDLNRNSVLDIWYRYVEKSIGLNQRVRLMYAGDATHEGAPSSWIYYRVTR